MGPLFLYNWVVHEVRVLWGIGGAEKRCWVVQVSPVRGVYVCVCGWMDGCTWKS